MALIDTPGAADADTYASVAFAAAYNAQHPYGDGWASLTLPKQEGNLVLARYTLDGWPRAWTGAAATATQALPWPRTGMRNRNGFEIPADEIPIDLKRAQSELARKISESDVTANNDIVNQGIKSIGVGPISLAFAGLDSVNSTQVARVQRELDAMMAMLPDSVKMLLVPSWLLEDPELKPRTLLLETL